MEAQSSSKRLMSVSHAFEQICRIRPIPGTSLLFSRQYIAPRNSVLAAALSFNACGPLRHEFSRRFENFGWGGPIQHIYTCSNLLCTHERVLKFKDSLRASIEFHLACTRRPIYARGGTLRSWARWPAVPCPTSANRTKCALRLSCSTNPHQVAGLRPLWSIANVCQLQ